MIPPSRSLLRTFLVVIVIAMMLPRDYSIANDGAETTQQQQDPRSREITADVFRSNDNMTITLRATFPDDTPIVKVSLFNLLGKLVEVNPVTTAVKGLNTFPFRTRGLPNGPYIVVLEAAGQRIINKVMLSR